MSSIADHPLGPSPQTRLRRLPDRGSHDPSLVHAILDAGMLCHVGIVVDGLPRVVPTLYWRQGDHIFWHGSRASVMIESAAAQSVCLTVSHLDGLVLARSAFHHSVNYRSVMLFGQPRLVDDPDEKLAALRQLIDSLTPGRWDRLRPITAQEIKATAVLTMPIDCGSAKIRQGGPKDDLEDLGVPVWAGVIPWQAMAGAAEPDDACLPGCEPPKLTDRLQSIR